MKPIISDAHILVRYSDEDAPAGGVIKAHEKVLKKEGEVLIGKFGRPISAEKINRLNKQIASGERTLIYLVKRTDAGYVGHSGELIEITRELEKSKSNISLIPEYYRENKFVHVWFRVKSLIPEKFGFLENLIIISSGFQASDTLPKSVAGAFLVKSGNANDFLPFSDKLNPSSMQPLSSLAKFIESIGSGKAD